MKIPITSENQADCQKIKKSIWQLGGQENKQVSSMSYPLTRGFTSSRTLKLDKTRLFKPCNTLNRVNTRSKNNSQQSRQDENLSNITSKENQPKQSYSSNNNESIISVLGQLEQYERIKINSVSKIFNANNSRYNMDIEDEENLKKLNNTKQVAITAKSNNQNRLPLSQINNNSSQIFSSNSSLSDITQPKNQAIQIEDNSDDEKERILSEKLNQNVKIQEKSITSSIASTNLSSSSSSSLLQTIENTHSKLINTNQNSERKESFQDSSKKPTVLNEHIDGYRIYKKGEKLFTFKIFKEDFLKIPTEFSKVITHSQDDDVSSDEDIVRGGIKFNYKSILKEIYSESRYQSTPPLVIPSSYFA